MQPYQIAITAGIPQQLRAVGNYIRFVEADQDTAVLVVSGQLTGAKLRLRPGQGARLPSDEQFWTFVEASGAAVTGWVNIGNGGFEDDRITGTVSVIDGALSRTVSGTSFSARMAIAPSVGNLSAVQLWNPVGSGKNLFVKQLMIGMTVAGIVQVKTYTVQLANAFANPALNKDPGGGPASAALLRYQYYAAAVAVDPIYAVMMPVNVSSVYQFTEPVMLRAGRGLLLETEPTNVQLQSSCEYVEANA